MPRATQTTPWLGQRMEFWVMHLWQDGSLWLSLAARGSFTAEGMRTFPRGSPYLVTNRRCSRDGCSVCSFCETDNSVYGLQPWSCPSEPYIPIKTDNLPHPFLQSPLGDREECCGEQAGSRKMMQMKTWLPRAAHVSWPLLLLPSRLLIYWYDPRIENKTQELVRSD